MKHADLLSVDEAAQYLGVAAKWLRRAGERGPRRTMLGRTLKFTKTALDEYVERCTEKVEWDSTNRKTHNTGGQDSKLPVLKSGAAQVRSIADELRRSSGASGPKLKPMHLVGVPHATKASQT